MTKVKSPQISLMMRRSKTNSKGEHPISLCVSMNGRVEKSSGIWLLEKHWDAQRQCVKRSCPNYLNVQHSLHSLLREAEDRKMELERLGQPYSPRDIVSPQKPTLVLSGRYEDVQYHYVTSKALNIGTIKTYSQVYNILLKSLGNGFLVSDITNGFIRNWMRDLSSSGMKTSNILKILKTCHTICLYALSKGLIDTDPFDGIRMGVLDKSHRVYYLETVHVKMIRELMEDMLGHWDGVAWHWKNDKVYERLHTRWTDEFSIGFFWVLLKMHGAAPIDAAMLRNRDVKMNWIDGEEYYCITFRRRKTHAEVVVNWKKDYLSDILLGDFLNVGDMDGYVYPILKGDEKDVVKACGAVCRGLIVRLRKLLDKVNERILGLVNEGQVINPIDTENVVYYTARHTLATLYINKDGANVAELAQIMGRSVSGIGTYVHQLTSEADTVARLKRLEF